MCVLGGFLLCLFPVFSLLEPSPMASESSVEWVAIDEKALAQFAVDSAWQAETTQKRAASTLQEEASFNNPGSSCDIEYSRDRSSSGEGEGTVMDAAARSAQKKNQSDMQAHACI